MSSDLGVEEQKIRAVCRYESSPLFSNQERVALKYADAITYSGQDVDDELFAEVRTHFSENQIVELTTYIAWENCSSKFNRALRIESQELWKPEK
ncbi:MAG: carboxymuconolactone decarboxylase family protein [Verrucomicrobia bacterium]|nr:carboxymuconolactone decarboxylase family protein [Verrucomicrobiota bacterium]